MEGKLIVCDTCGCTLTVEEAKRRGWGSLWVGEHTTRPQCSYECACVLYTPDFVDAHFIAPRKETC